MLCIICRQERDKVEGVRGSGVEQAEGPQRDLVITVIVSDLCDDPADDC